MEVYCCWIWSIWEYEALKSSLRLDKLSLLWELPLDYELVREQHNGQKHGRIQDFFGGNTCWKFSKNFRKLRKCIIFAKKFSKPCVYFSSIWRKNTSCWKFWENFLNVEKTLLRKLRKVHDLSIFFKKFNKPCAYCLMTILYKIWIFILFLFWEICY